MVEDENDLDMIYRDNYRRLFLLGVMDIKSSKKIIVPGHMDLNIDVLEDDDKTRVIAMAHNIIVDCDLIADPEMTIKLFKNTAEAKVLTYKIYSLGVYEKVYESENVVDYHNSYFLNRYLNNWLITLNERGYYLGIISKYV
ncbi:MAG: DUF1249 domain-containing protein [Candidatus Thermoplasmatota archaeon]|nr:DUF1249 domain-containing protein [Candidatus Thermoplasmatota archaeon]